MKVPKFLIKQEERVTAGKLPVPISKERLQQLDQSNLNDSLSIGDSFSIGSDSAFKNPIYDNQTRKDGKKSIYIRNGLLTQTKFNTSGTNLSVDSNISEEQKLKKKRNQAQMNSTFTSIRTQKYGQKSLFAKSDNKDIARVAKI